MAFFRMYIVAKEKKDVWKNLVFLFEVNLLAGLFILTHKVAGTQSEQYLLQNLCASFVSLFRKDLRS